MRSHRFLSKTGLALAAVLALAVTSLAGCAQYDASAPDLETEIPDIRGSQDPGDPYVGLLDSGFREDLDAYARLEVTLLVDVDEVLSPRAFTVTSPGGGDVEPVLAITTADAGDVEVQAGRPLLVAATPVRDFEAAVVIDELGLDVDPEQLADWEDETFLVATIVEAAP